MLGRQNLSHPSQPAWGPNDRRSRKLPPYWGPIEASGMPSTSPGSPQTLKCQWLLRHASSPTKSLRSPILHRLDPCPQTPATNGGHASWHSAGVRLRGESTRRPEKECACWVHHRLSQPPAALRLPGAQSNLRTTRQTPSLHEVKTGDLKRGPCSQCWGLTFGRMLLGTCATSSHSLQQPEGRSELQSGRLTSLHKAASDETGGGLSPAHSYRLTSAHPHLVAGFPRLLERPALPPLGPSSPSLFPRCSQGSSPFTQVS